MAVYATRGLFTAALVYLAKETIPFVISPSILSKNEKITAPGPVFNFAQEQATKMGLKNLILIKNNRIFFYGNSWFGRMGISIPRNIDLDAELPAIDSFRIIHVLAHLKSNDLVSVTLVTLITSIFTLVVLNSKNPVAAPVVGVIVGVVSLALFWNWREKTADITALSNCSKAVNQAFLTHLIECEKEDKESWLSKIWRLNFDPTTSQRIQYVEAFIAKQADA